MSTSQDFPILLVPGIARFDFLRDSALERLERLFGDDSLQSDLLHYFKGIRSHLRAEGLLVEYADTGFAEGIEERIPQLRQSLEAALAKHERDRAILIGHSMGGLDSRYLIATEPEVAEKVAVLATIGTPHLGDSFADYAILEQDADDLIDWAEEELRLDFHGFEILTSEAMEALNESLRDAEASNTVTYVTYASWQERDKIFPPLRISWDIIFAAEGENDGLVSAVSQAWHAEIRSHENDVKKIEQRTFPVSADHLNQTGRWDIGEWQWNLTLNQLRQIGDYERTIRDAYLEVARELIRLALG